MDTNSSFLFSQFIIYFVLDRFLSLPRYRMHIFPVAHNEIKCQFFLMDPHKDLVNHEPMIYLIFAHLSREHLQLGLFAFNFFPNNQLSPSGKHGQQFEMYAPRCWSPRNTWIVQHPVKTRECMWRIHTNNFFYELLYWIEVA